jgi:hypothetical protein
VSTKGERLSTKKLSRNGEVSGTGAHQCASRFGRVADSFQGYNTSPPYSSVVAGFVLEGILY